jgi:hypothetical protein
MSKARFEATFQVIVLGGWTVVMLCFAVIVVHIAVMILSQGCP